VGKGMRWGRCIRQPVRGAPVEGPQCQWRYREGERSGGGVGWGGEAGGRERDRRGDKDSLASV
jgi:hypothetical protein